MLDIISVGDATLDVFLQVDQAEAALKCELRTELCQICFDYADKIPIESVVKIPGAGNASNNAVGSSRLGMRTALFSILGADDVGKSIYAHWRKEKISTEFVRFDKKRGTNYSTVLNYGGERTILVFHEKRDYAFPALPKAKWIYWTSLGKGSEKMHGKLIDYVKRTGTKLCFQPGTFQLKLGTDKLRPLIAASEVTVMNKEEAERLVGNGAKAIPALLKRLHDIGCHVAVITDGPKGSYAYDGKRFLKMAIMDVPVVERTGCGDSFATAFVAALDAGKDVAEAMRWGTANSASVISYIGPQKGLLKTSEMRRMLKRFARVCAEEI